MNRYGCPKCRQFNCSCKLKILLATKVISRKQYKFLLSKERA